METLNECFELTFVLSNSIISTRDSSEAVARAILAQKKSSLISYLLLQILYKMIAYYSSQMLCVNKIVSIMAKDVNL